jgi:hypothetical protein
MAEPAPRMRPRVALGWAQISVLMPLMPPCPLSPPPFLRKCSPTRDLKTAENFRSCTEGLGCMHYVRHVNRMHQIADTCVHPPTPSHTHAHVLPPQARRLQRQALHFKWLGLPPLVSMRACA